MTAVAAESTRPGETFWQNVQTPATHEFSTTQPDLFGHVTAAVRLADARRESHDPVFVTHQSSIRNRAARHVACKVFDDVFR